ncbi:PIN domain-containing protein [Tumidithrix elongata RA019]|uniref:PIN domain-containing protein n=1 Tax=Tumidithrix elongata BACA0141 TaxID=2716417 RepID=A0AAW9PTU6_9CYAN|nr:PIN domain-containing protein [Tumidithrix elongata RA019]
MTAILDTSFLFALTDKSDRNHALVYNIAQNIQGDLLLPVVVLPEVCYLIGSRLGHQAMRSFLSQLASSAIQIESVTVNDIQRVNEILEQYADSQLDFVDACIVTIAERESINHILTLDRRDFSIIRPKHCQYFEIP